MWIVKPDGTSHLMSPHRMKGHTLAVDLHHPTQWLRWITANARRLLVLVVGTLLLGAGLAMLLLPGPGILVSIIGLAVLATEFAWAERALDRSKSTAATATTKLTSSRVGSAAFKLSASVLILGGIAVMASSGDHRVLGGAMFLTGLCALIVLFPAARRLLDRSASTVRPDANALTTSISEAGPSRPELPGS